MTDKAPQWHHSCPFCPESGRHWPGSSPRGTWVSQWKKMMTSQKNKWRRATTTSDPKGHASVQCGSKSQDCLRPWEVRVKMTGSHWRSGTWNWRMDNKLQWAFQQWKPSCSCIPWTLLSPSLTMAVIIIRMLPNLRCKRVVNRLHDGDKFKSTLNHELSLTLTELTDLNFKSRNLNSMTWSAMEGSVTFLTCLSNNSRTKCSSIFLEDHSILVVLGQGYRQLKIIVNEIMCWYMHDTKEDSARVTQVLD